MATLSKPEIEAKKVEILLLLWDMSEGLKPISKGKLTSRIKRKHEKSADFESIYLDLAQEKAIEIVKESRYEKIKLTEQGKTLLGQGLGNKSFSFYSKGERSVVGAKVADALLKWIRQQEGQVSFSAPRMIKKTEAETDSRITSYEAFKPVALEIYNQLNRDYNYDDLVPIYRIRREVGNRLSRADFNEWMIEMQANDIFLLMESSVEDGAFDKIQDSVKTPFGELRCYAKFMSN